MHLVQCLRGIVPLHLIAVLEEQVTILDGMVAVLPLVHRVVLRCPRTHGHLLVVFLVIVTDSVVGGDIRTIVGVELCTVGNRQEGVVDDTTGKRRKTVHLRDVVVVLQCRLEEVVTGGESANDTEATDKFQYILFHILSVFRSLLLRQSCRNVTAGLSLSSSQAVCALWRWSADCCR